MKRYTRKIRRRYVRGGADEKDIEMGNMEDEVEDVIGEVLPPNPGRFSEYEEQIRQESFRKIGKDLAEKYFEKGPPEKRQKEESKKMSDEDPLNKEPFELEELQIFSNRGGRRRRRTSRRLRRNSRRTRKNSRRRR